MVKRRGLVDFGGNALKFLFGTATLTDIHLLLGLLNDLQLKNSDMAHALSSQLTYVKDLTTTTKLNSEVICNLSSIIRENIVQSHDQFQQVTRDMLWLNITLYEQNTLYTTIKQVELTLSQLTQNIDDLQHSQQAYVLLTETSFNRCDKSTLTVSPADILVYQAQALTYEISLYFQKSDTHRLCRRQLLLNHDTPFLHRHGTI